MPLMPVQLGTGSNPGRQGQDSVARMINCYVEAIGDEGKTPLPIYACDGFNKFSGLTDWPVRSMIPLDEFLFVVAGNTLFSVRPSGQATTIGKIGSDSGHVSMVRNRKMDTPQIGITNGGVYYVVENNSISTIDLSGLVNAGKLVSCIVHDGYFVLLFDNGFFYITSSDEATAIDPLENAAAESKPDGLVAGARRGREIMLMGAASTEFWQNTGSADFPFERTTTIDVGCYAAGAVQEVLSVSSQGASDTVIWAATNDQGSPAGVVMLEGYGARKISTFDLDRKLRSSNPETLQSQTWTSGGHVFYVLSGSDWSYQYDTTTGRWVERQSADIDRWRISTASSIGGETVLGDYINGSLYKLAPASYSTDVSALTVERSIDNGLTYGPAYTIDIGTDVDTMQRFKLMRLGATREDGAVFRLKLTNALVEAGQSVGMTIIPPAVHAYPNRMRFNRMYVDVIPGSSQNSNPKGITGWAVDADVVKPT